MDWEKRKCPECGHKTIRKVLSFGSELKQGLEIFSCKHCGQLIVNDPLEYPSPYYTFYKAEEVSWRHNLDFLLPEVQQEVIFSD